MGWISAFYASVCSVYGVFHKNHENFQLNKPIYTTVKFRVWKTREL